MKWLDKLTVLSRYLLAIVFIFSGFVKGIDPWGTAYKLGDYFVSFHLQFLNPTALLLSITLAAAEFYIGLLLLFGIRIRLAIWGAFLFMLFFTPLTLVLAITNPISDCGCFGDAVKLSNWETFYKNVIFMGAAAVLFANRKKLTDSYRTLHQVILTIVLLIFAVAPSIHGYRNQPMLDFRPFHIGANLYEYTRIPENASHDEYKTILYYSKNGQVKEFDETNYPWDDSTWTFVDSKSILVKKGYTPPITNFSLYSELGIDYTDSILHSKGYLVLVVIPSKNYLTEPCIKRLLELQKLLMSANIKAYVLTAMVGSDLVELQDKRGLYLPLLQADEILLKTIVRSHPGVLLLLNGTIIGKWHWRDVPLSIFSNSNDILALQLTSIEKSRGQSLVLILSLFLLLTLSVAHLTQK